MEAAPPSTPLRTLLGNASFRRLVLGQLVSLFGTSCTQVALMARYATLRGSTDGWAVFAGVRAIPYALFGLLVGQLVDRFDRRRVVLAVDLARAGLYVAIGLTDRLPWLYGLAFAAATCDAVYGPTYRSLVGDVLEKPLLLGAGSFEASASELLYVAGVGLSSLLVASGHITVCFALDAATYLFSALNVARVATVAREPAQKATGSTAARWFAGFDAIRRDPGLRYPVALSLALTLLVAYADPMFFPLVGLRDWGGAGAVGAFYVANAIGCLLTGLYLLRGESSPLRRPLVLAVVLAIDGGIFVFIGRTHHLALAVGACLFTGITDTLMKTYAVSEIQRRAPSHLSGRVFASIALVSEPMAAVATFGSAVVIGAASAAWGFVSAGVVEGVMAAGAVAWSRRAPDGDYHSPR